MFYDVIIVGGGPAGLSCALILGRCRRKIVVFDTGVPRNRASDGLHGFISRDGCSPIDLLEKTRKELDNYGVRVVQEKIIKASKTDQGFCVQTSTGDVHKSKKLVLATGVRDKLPNLPNVLDYYGKSIHHCPYCDGWEAKDHPIGIYAWRRGGAIELSLTMKTWSKDITLFTKGVKGLTANDLHLLKTNGIKLCNGDIKALNGVDGILEGVLLKDNTTIGIRSLFFSTGNEQHSDLAQQLGCKCTKKGAINYNELQQTNIEGLFVAGDMAKDMQLIIVAAAEGAKAGVIINKELNKEERIR